MRKRILLLMTMFHLMICIVYSQVDFSITKEKIIRTDNYLNRCVDSTKFMGYIIISNSDSVIFEKGYGYADIENKIPFTRKTQICICSSMKIITSSLIMKLIEENKIQLDDTIGKFFPNLPYGNKVTIRHLLSHKSGLSYYQADPNYWKHKTCKEHIPFISNQKLKFEPGSSMFYSTSGMILLGAILEKVYDKDFTSIIKEHITIPFQMNNTLFESYKGALEYNSKGYSIAKSYSKSKENLVLARPLSRTDSILVPLSAGGQFSCAEDIYKFDHAFHNYKIVTKQSIELMSEKQGTWENICFGLGCIIDNPNTLYEAIGHGGCSNLYYNHFIKQDFTMILLTMEYYDDIFSKAKDIEKILFK